MNKMILAGILGASIALGSCGTTNYYVVLPEQTMDSALNKTRSNTIGSSTVTVQPNWPLSQPATQSQAEAILQEVDCGQLKQTFVVCKSVFDNAANAEDQGIQALQTFETKYANELEFCNKVVEINWITATPYCFLDGV